MTEVDGSFETLRSSVDAESEAGVTLRLCAVVFSNFIWWLFGQLAKTVFFRVIISSIPLSVLSSLGI